MKFKFCGDSDCQDWLLAQINLLSKLTSIKIKIVLNEVIKHILTGSLDFAKICKLTSDAKLSEDETKAVVAALNFIIVSSSKYDTESEIVLNELQQLGLPREHSVALCKVYSDNLQRIQEALKEQSLKYDPLKGSSYDIKSAFRSDSFAVECPSIILNLKGGQASNVSTSFYLTHDKLDHLIRDLKEAYQIMENLNV